jgi:hypothetical protein
MVAQVVERFLSFRRIPLRIVAITALASYALQIGAIVQGQPLYIIALYTLIPWIPLAVFEGIWKYEHYGWIAAFAVVTALQVGHLGEHALQVTQLRVLDGVLACPPPRDTEANARRAVELGLRPTGQESTGKVVTSVVHATPDGQPVRDAAGQPVSGPPACGVFGQLDFETVHLVWDTLVWVGALWLLTKFPRNPWLWVAMVAASAHEVEHLFLGAIFFFDTAKQFTYTETLWATTVNGNSITAYPAGVRQTLVDFYDAGGKTGIMGRAGLFEQVFGLKDVLPIRPYLHFGYNTFVVVPTVIAFFVQVRRAYDEYLARALPQLTEEQLVRATPRLQSLRFPAGAVIVHQGDPADRFYIITRGFVEVVRHTPDGREVAVNRLGEGQYFGEIGLLHGGRRIATVRAVDAVEVLALDRETFVGLMQESEMSRAEVDRLVRQRVLQVRALQ